MTKYAPVIIPTLCRFEQLKNCINSLQQNKYAAHTELFIGLDYPSKESQKAGYNKIKEYLSNGIEGFLQVHVFEHPQNIGWYQNYNELRKEVFRVFDCYIYTEDDNIFSPNFLEYMNKNLLKYKDDNTVLAISGYSFPVNWGVAQDNILEINTYFSAWGYAIWRAKEEEMLKFINMDNFDLMMHNNSYMHRLRKSAPNQYCNFIKAMVQYTDMLIKDNNIMAIDLSYGLYMIYTQKNMIFPTISKVRNMGHTAEGLNCKKLEYNEDIFCSHRNYDFSKQPLDCQKDYIASDDICPLEVENIYYLLNQFFSITRKESLTCQFTHLLYRILGREKITKLIKKLGAYAH